jgi:hypothetical protein
VQQLRVKYWHEIGAVKLEDLVFEGWNRFQFSNDTTLCSFPQRVRPRFDKIREQQGSHIG